MKTLSVLFLGIVLGVLLATITLPVIASEWTWSAEDDDKARYGRPNGGPSFAEREAAQSSYNSVMERLRRQQNPCDR